MHAEWLQIFAECGPGMLPSYIAMKDFFADLQAELQIFGKKPSANAPGLASDNWRIFPALFPLPPPIQN